MSRILIGDVHGFTNTYQKWLRRNLAADQHSIQLGDMGLGFKGVGLHEMPNHKFIRGNHDNPAKCRAHKNYLGDFGYEDTSGIFYISGAFSIDRDMRVEGVSWWADEELSYDELGQAIDLYEKTKPRFVVSHECPTIAGSALLHRMNGAYFADKLACTRSRTAEAMQQMLDIHQPSEWVFGHYHIDKSFLAPSINTKFRCVGGMMEPNDKPYFYELKYEFDAVQAHNDGCFYVNDLVRALNNGDNDGAV